MILILVLVLILILILILIVVITFVALLIGWRIKVVTCVISSFILWIRMFVVIIGRRTRVHIGEIVICIIALIIGSVREIIGSIVIIVISVFAGKSIRSGLSIFICRIGVIIIIIVICVIRVVWIVSCGFIGWFV